MDILDKLTWEGLVEYCGIGEVRDKDLRKFLISLSSPTGKNVEVSDHSSILSWSDGTYICSLDTEKEKIHFGVLISGEMAALVILDDEHDEILRTAHSRKSLLQKLYMTCLGGEDEYFSLFEMESPEDLGEVILTYRK